MTAGASPIHAMAAPVLLVSLSFAIVNFALPVRLDALGGGGLAVGASFSVFTLFLLLGRPVVGWGLDRYGRKPFLVGAMWAYSATMLCFAWASGIVGLLVARALQGLASALLFVSLRTWISDHTAQGGRAEAMGRMTEVTVRGGIAGMFLAMTVFGAMGFIAGWPIVFVIFSGGAVLAALWTTGRVVAANVPAQEELPETPESRAPSASLSVILLLAAACVSATSGTAFAFVMLRLARSVDGDMQQVGLWILPVALILAFLPSRLGRLTDVHGPRRTVPPAMLIGIAAGALLAATEGPAFAAVGFAGVVVASATAEPALAALAGGSDAATRGRRYGRFELASGMGGVAGPLIAGALAEACSLAASFWWVTGLLVVALPLLWSSFDDPAVVESRVPL